MRFRVHGLRQYDEIRDKIAIILLASEKLGDCVSISFQVGHKNMRRLVYGAASVAIALANPVAAQESPKGTDDLLGGVVTGIILRNIKDNADPRKSSSKKPQVYTAPTFSFPQPLDSALESPLDRQNKRELQVLLNSLGYSAGVPDGVVGRRTRAAIEEYRVDAGLGTQEPPTVKDILILRAALRTRDLLGLNLTTEQALKQAVSIVTNPIPEFKTASVKQPVEPTRRFASPSTYPPEVYRGYGVVAFKSLATDYDRIRHKLICEAYFASLVASSASPVAVEDQFVTIWPMRSSELAATLNSTPSEYNHSNCEQAIENYSLQISQEVIAQAKRAGFDDQGVGPFLLGWLPGSGYGREDALILVLDFSRVESYSQAQALFQEWKTDVQSDEALLGGGFSVEMLRRKIRRWSDLHGVGFFSYLSGSG